MAELAEREIALDYLRTARDVRVAT